MKNKMELIDKAAVVAEIKMIISKLRKSCNPNPFGTLQECLTDAEIEALHLILDYINTLETKEVDLEKEIQEVHKHFHDYYGIVNSDTNEFAKVDDIIHIAKHFFELGIKSKGE